MMSPQLAIKALFNQIETLAVLSSESFTWPLLLKNYDKLLVRSSHFTPIPFWDVSPLTVTL